MESFLGVGEDGGYLPPLLLTIVNYYIDIDEIPGFLLLLKNYIFTARSEVTCEDIGVVMVTNTISQ